MLLMIDNYDSFTYNLVQYFGELGGRCRCCATTRSRRRHRALKPDAARCSRPGPARRPRPASACRRSAHFAGKVPILGVCLGHQAIGAALGGKVVRARAADARQDERDDAPTGAACMPALPRRFTVIRYHSLAIERESLPAEPRRDLDRERRRDHGRAPPRAGGQPDAARGRAVPPRIDPHRARARDAAELPGAAAMNTSSTCAAIR